MRSTGQAHRVGGGSMLHELRGSPCPQRRQQRHVQRLTSAAPLSNPSSSAAHGADLRSSGNVQVSSRSDGASSSSGAETEHSSMVRAPGTVQGGLMQQLLAQAGLNERLSGSMQPAEVVQKLDFLRTKRENWQSIYEHVTKQDAASTLAMIEEADRKVDEALSEEARGRSSVTNLQATLTALQKEVDEAHARLHVTQARVEQNLQRVEELKAESVALERLRMVSVRPAVALASAASTSNSSINSSSVDGSSSSASTPSSSGRVGVLERGETSTSYSSAASTTRGSKVAKAPPRKNRGLQSSMDAEDGLRNFWYPAEFSSKLDAKTLIPFDIFGEPWVLFRDAKGQPACIKDECAHRACPLSLGVVSNGEVACAYHGWTFNEDGMCTKMPSTAHCRNVGVAALPCAEKDGFIWVWPGEGMPPAVPTFAAPIPGYDIHAEIVVDVPVEHGLLMENLLDLAHAPFTHTTTFARGWPVPDFVRFHASKVLQGNWDPYPIDMSFQPPCMVLSLIGLEQPGKIQRGVKAASCKRHLHQLHVCMPSKRGHTRLLYRMSLDFLPWLRAVPFIDRVWKNVAGQVLSEDLVLVKGQQDRLQAGSDTWANPVSYDKLAVRYRRWRNAVAHSQGAVIGSDGLLQTGHAAAMSAGELFALEESATDGRIMEEDECPVPF